MSIEIFPGTENRPPWVMQNMRFTLHWGHARHVYVLIESKLLKAYYCSLYSTTTLDWGWSLDTMILIQAWEKWEMGVWIREGSKNKKDTNLCPWNYSSASKPPLPQGNYKNTAKHSTRQKRVQLITKGWVREA